MSSLDHFHPLIQSWFLQRFDAPTEPQALGWPEILGGSSTLIAAPTGSGKTLTAFLASIDRLFREGLERPLPEEIRVLYVSPLRALSNDMQRNLELPLEEIHALAAERGLSFSPIRTGLRTGDSSPAARQAIVKHPPHILVTTPESLYLLLTGEKSREKLRTVETVIVDEIHSLIRDKRGSHLALSLERLEHLAERPIQRIGLSATQRPIEMTAGFLVGNNPDRQCKVLDLGHHRQLDLQILAPESELGPVCAHEQWAEVNRQIVTLVEQHRSTLIFVNTRRMAERLTHQLTELMGTDVISSHHGSLAADLRQKTEQSLKNGQLKAVVATASLELGLDIGYIDLVIQIGSPRSIGTFLQRVGRSGHALGLTPKGKLVALTRDEVLECMALIRGIRSGQLDRVPMPIAPLDILAQQIVAEVSMGEWNTDDLFEMIRQSSPYANLPRYEFDRILQILSEGIAHNSGRSRVHLHHDQIGKRVKARKGARITAATNGGAIPEIASYRVIADPDRTVVGSLDEDFSVESQAGDVFLLGNTSWRILNVRGGEVNVVDAAGAPPTIPFWFGEAPGRTIELSQEVSKLRSELELRIGDPGAAVEWLVETAQVSQEIADQIVTYVAAQKAAIGLVPTQKKIVYERFFDESGGMQLVIHAPFGSRITRAWGLAMRKRFCRSFDFELQATADDDGIILSLGPQHSFPLESMFAMLNRENTRRLLEQAVLASPLFETRWRWNVMRSLLVARQSNGKKVPPPLQRFRSQDLLTSVFPAVTGCKEEIIGDIPLPDHPLIKQTMEDCLFEAMDLDNLLEVLDRIDRGEIELIARDTREPSPFSYELLNSNPYAFLDGGELQERRARAVATRRSLTVESVSDLGHLDPLAIEQVVRDAQPQIRDADELHDSLLTRFLIPEAELLPFNHWLHELQTAGRVARVEISPPEQPLESRPYWSPAERLSAVREAYPNLVEQSPFQIPDALVRHWDPLAARLAVIRGLIEICGPVRASDLAHRLAITVPQAEASLEALEGEGIVLRGRFTPAGRAKGDWDPDAPPPAETPPQAVSELEWCHRRLLARIHRLTMDGLRRQIEPVDVATYQQFLFQHHGIHHLCRKTGENGLFEVISQLQGLDLPAMAWEADLFASRMDAYAPQLLDELCLEGTVTWGRLFPPQRDPDRSRPMVSLTRVVPISLFIRNDLPWLSANSPLPDLQGLTSRSLEVLTFLQFHGASFSDDLATQLQLIPIQLEESLGELISCGFVNADGFGGFRQLLEQRADTHSPRRTDVARRRHHGLTRTRSGIGKTGRWSQWRKSESVPTILSEREIVEAWAWQLLRRWGVVFRDLLNRESGAPPWWELLQVFRRLEATGEIRGGRFISGVGGEQYALGETIRALRHIREQPPSQELIAITAADPVNLVGIITSHPRVPATALNRVVFHNGVPLAARQGGEFRALSDISPELLSRVESSLGLPSSRQFSCRE